jgi:hypothetical protein
VDEGTKATDGNGKDKKSATGEGSNNSNKGGDFEAMRRLSKAAHSRGKIDLAGAKQRKQQKALKRQQRRERLAQEQEADGMDIEPPAITGSAEVVRQEVAQPQDSNGGGGGGGGGGAGAKSNMKGGSRAELAALRSEVGVMSKRLLNEGRAAWLRECGWQARLVEFVEKGTSPENTLLVATRRR